VTRPLRTSALLTLAAGLAACANASGPEQADTQPLDVIADNSTIVTSSTDSRALPRPTNPPPSNAAGDDTVTANTDVSANVEVGGGIDLGECAASMPLRDRIALLVWPAVYSDDWDTALRTVAEHRVGGVVLMEPTGWGPDDVAPQLARLDAAAPRGLVVATDEEGGVVQRLSIIGPIPSQQSVSEEQDPDEARRLIAGHGERLAEVGVDMVLGPVVDVVPASGSVPLARSRFFTGDPTTVAAYAQAYVQGWVSSGLSPVIKHYPGHGAASGDTHDEAGITPGLDALEAWDLVPFRALAGTGTAVMVGHLTVPGLTDGVPATQSERAVGYLRDELGYRDALVMTDALGMQAVGLPEDEAAVRALAAGIDVVIFTATGQTAPVIDAIERAVAGGTLTDDRITLSAVRVLREFDADRTGCVAG
jgi:beta-N-acetylhexosaminidase